VLLPGVEGDALLTVLMGAGELTTPKPRAHLCPTGFDEKCRIVLAFGVGQELLCQCLRRLGFFLLVIIRPQPIEHREDL
jgi:hypothetical protein